MTTAALGIVDAHHHLWDPASAGSGWLGDEALAPINRPYGLAADRVVRRELAPFVAGAATNDASSVRRRSAGDEP